MNRKSAFGPRGVLLVVGGLLFSGCYKYLPTDIAVAPVDEQLRLVVTPDGATDLAQFSEVDGQVRLVIGQLVGREEQTLLLRVSVSRRVPDEGRLDLDQIVRIPIREILSAQRRELDRTKTGLLLGGVVAAGKLLFLRSIQAMGSKAEPGDLPDLTILSIPVG